VQIVLSAAPANAAKISSKPKTVAKPLKHQPPPPPPSMKKLQIVKEVVKVLNMPTPTTNKPTKK
jgi:hypothetical protein